MAIVNAFATCRDFKVLKVKRVPLAHPEIREGLDSTDIKGHPDQKVQRSDHTDKQINR